ncbi:MAG: putative selenate ABC transporter substrate-binding protein [Microcoleaceae cyanobacterium]
MKNRILISGFFWIGLLLTACSTPTAQTSPSSEEIQHQNPPLVIAIVYDTDAKKQQRQSEKLVTYLESELEIPVEYRLIPNSNAAITAFKQAEIELVWLDGLNGVKARSKVQGASAIVQRDIDEQFYSLFIAHQSSGLPPFNDLFDLEKLKGKTIIFAGRYSISGRIMPQYFLQQAGVSLEDFAGKPNFSVTPEYTIQQVETGSYDVGVVNETLWQQKVDTNTINLEQVYVIWRTPAYSNYHWVIHPNIQQKYGQEMTQKIQQAFFNLDPSIPSEKEILDLFETGRFIPTNNQNYNAIEEISKQLNLIQ